MTQTARKLIAGNWKMNGLTASLAEIGAVKEYVQSENNLDIDTALCLPATIITLAAHLALGSSLSIGGQDCHANTSGAHTGDVSAQMLADVGAKYVIVGHSERRADHGETDAGVKAKASAVISAGLVPIICVGETEAERRAGKALEIVAEQLAGSIPDEANTRDIVVAYEPVWAIGTGLTPTTKDIAEVHDDIRRQLVERFSSKGNVMPILYGGSMKPANAEEILSVSNVDGGLIGGASLKAADFTAIIKAAVTSA